LGVAVILGIWPNQEPEQRTGGLWRPNGKLGRMAARSALAFCGGGGYNGAWKEKGSL